MGALDLLADVLEGPEGSDSGGFGGAVERGLQFGLMSGPVGDAVDALSGITGSDVLSGQGMSTWQRGLALAGLAGIGVLGAQTLRGMGPPQVLGAQRAAEFRDALRVTAAPSDPLQQTQHAAIRALLPGEGMYRPGAAALPAPGPPTELDGLTVPVRDESRIWGTLSGFSNRALGARPDPTVGYQDLTSALSEITPNRWDEAAFGQAEGFLNKLAHRYLDEVPAHQYSLQNYAAVDLTPEEAAVHAAGYELARWQWAVENRLLKGKRFSAVLGTPGKPGPWRKLLDGQDLTDAETALLADAMVEFANEVAWLPHPELSAGLRPDLALAEVNLDDGPRSSLQNLRFDTVGLEQLTWQEANDRVSALFATNPGAMVDPMVDNIESFFRTNVTDHDISEFRDWYVTARTDSVRIAKERGYDPRLLIAAAAVASGGENWSGNIVKAADILDLVHAATPGPGAFEALKAAVKAKGHKASGEDLARIILLDASDNPVEFFTSGRKDGATLEELAARWETGEPLQSLIADRSMSDPWKSVKQEAFTYGIWESFPEDLAAQAEATYRLLSGDFAHGSGMSGDLDAVLGGGQVRRDLPVVVDRHAIKVALGFSMNPDTWLSSQKNGYDVIAQAYRIAAGRLGELGGRPVLPEELQAMTWVRLRALTGVTDDLGNDWKGKRPFVQRPGWLRPSAQLGGWTDGVGPDYVFSTNILDIVTGKDRAALPVNGVDAGADLGSLTTPLRALQQGTSFDKKNKHLRFEITQGPDGQTLVVAPDGADLPVDALRTRWPTRARIGGRQVWAPVAPARVRDAEAELQRLADDTYQAASPSQAGPLHADLHPVAAPDVWRRDGVFMSIDVVDRDGTAAGLHNRMLAELDRRGITVTEAKVHPVGFTSAAAEIADDGTRQQIREPRRTLTVGFGSAVDADRASLVLRQGPLPDPPVNVEFRPVDADVFAAAITAAREQTRGPKARPVGLTVYQYPTDEYRKMRLFLSEDGLTGFAVKPDGDLVSLFNVGQRGAGEAAVIAGIRAGGTKLDAFDQDGFLPDKYARYGFREYQRDGWNPEYAPDGWDETLDGTPSVTYMRLHPEDSLQATVYGQVPRVRVYVGGDAEAPKGFEKVYEHHSVDDAGRELVVVSRSGDVARSSSVPVWVPVGDVPRTRTRPLDVGGFGTHRFEPVEAGFVFDNQVMVLGASPEAKLRPVKDPKHLFDMKVDGKLPTAAAVLVPADGPPSVIVGASPEEVLAVVGDTPDVVLVTRHRKAGQPKDDGGTTAGSWGHWTVQPKEVALGEYPAMITSQVEELLRRSGLRDVKIGGRK